MPSPNCKSCRLSGTYCLECPNYDFTNNKKFKKSMRLMRYQEFSARVDIEDEVPFDPEIRTIAVEEQLQVGIPAWLEKVNKEKHG